MADLKKLICGSKSDIKLQEKKILQPLTYLRQTPGKGVVALWIKAFNYWLKVPANVVNNIVDQMNMFHDTSLLLDDVEDNSVLRRGLPAAHLIYGTPTVINSSYYSVFLSMKNMLELNHPETVNVLVEEILNLHRGQGLDIDWRENFTCPTEEQYIEMVRLKTSRILPIRLMQLFSENKADFTELAHMFAVYFQIRDDYCNLCDWTYADNKTYCDDLTEGKFSFPIIHAIRSHPDDSQVKYILRMRTTDNALKKHCTSLIEKCGSFQYTREFLTRQDKKIRQEIKRLGGNPILEQLLDALLTWQKK